MMIVVSRRIRRIFQSVAVCFGVISFFVYFSLDLFLLKRNRTVGHRANATSVKPNMKQFLPFASLEALGRHNGLITPHHYVFNIQILVYIYELIWMIYAATTLCRETSADILRPFFYFVWSFSCFLEIGNIKLLLDDNYFWAWICLCASSLLRNGCLFLAFRELYMYQRIAKIKHKPYSKRDIWMQRLFVQNCLLFRQSWASVLTCTGLQSILTNKFGLHEMTSSYVALSTLAFVIFIWFVFQNFKFEKYTRFCFAEYLVILVCLSGILVKIINLRYIGGIFSFLVAYLVLTALLFIGRMVTMSYHEGGRRKGACDKEKLLSVT